MRSDGSSNRTVTVVGEPDLETAQRRSISDLRHSIALPSAFILVGRARSTVVDFSLLFRGSQAAFATLEFSASKVLNREGGMPFCVRNWRLKLERLLKPTA